MRLTRRGCFVPKGMLYVWYVYSTAWEAEEFETGTFTPSRYGGNRMAADSYETSQDGFTLINPSSTSSSQLQVGDYLVDVSTNGSTAVSGEYLYRITGKTGSFWSQEFEYTSYKAVQKRGEVVLRIVESETPDYPIDGEYNGEWYVMMAGIRPMYVWDVFNIGQHYTMRDEGATINVPNPAYICEYSFSSLTGLFTITKNVKEEVTYVNGEYDTIALDYFWTPRKFSVGSTTDVMYQGSVYSPQLGHRSFYAYIGVLIENKGSATGTTVESLDPEAYPQVGVQGRYWYTYSHSYNYVFDNR